MSVDVLNAVMQTLSKSVSAIGAAMDEFDGRQDMSFCRKASASPGLAFQVSLHA